MGRKVKKETFERGKAVEKTGGRAASEIRPGEVGFGLPAARVETAGVVERKQTRKVRESWREEINEMANGRAGPLSSKGGGQGDRRANDTLQRWKMRRKTVKNSILRPKVDQELISDERS